MRGVTVPDEETMAGVVTTAHTEGLQVLSIGDDQVLIMVAPLSDIMALHLHMTVKEVPTMVQDQGVPSMAGLGALTMVVTAADHRFEDRGREPWIEVKHFA